MLRMSLCENHLDLHLTGATALLARRRQLRIPRERIHRAFVSGKSFAVNASPRGPCPGWASRRLRIGVFGFETPRNSGRQAPRLPYWLCTCAACRTTGSFTTCLIPSTKPRRSINGSTNAGSSLDPQMTASESGV
jgi:hypothetical protein